MYNPQLETFITVAESGSFAKAADKLYISPTAVIKQINILESNLDIKLFNRTHRGLTLTAAGKSLYSDARYIICYSHESLERAKNAILLNYRQCAGLELCRETLCCAAGINHPLAQKDKLSVSDLYGQNLMLITRGQMGEADALRDWLTVKHLQVNIIDFDFYNTEVFNSCENGNNLLMAVPTWRDVHPLLKIIPVGWNFTMPFGLLHSPQPAPHVQKCINAITRIYRENRA